MQQNPPPQPQQGQQPNPQQMWQQMQARKAQVEQIVLNGFNANQKAQWARLIGPKFQFPMPNFQG
jgi:hypothetical protein